jgi:hypothetical protein
MTGVLGKRKEMCLENIADENNAIMVHAAHAASHASDMLIDEEQSNEFVDQPVDDKQTVSLFDVLSVDLLFDTIVKCLFLFCNGVQSFCNVALVCRTTYKRALHQGRIKRVLLQSFPYLPDRILNANRSANEMFSLLMSLANPSLSLRFARPRPALYQYLLAYTLSSSSISARYLHNQGQNVQMFGQFGSSSGSNRLIIENDIASYSIPKRSFRCELRNTLLAIDVCWYDDFSSQLHSRHIECLFGTNSTNVGSDYEVYASSDIVAQNIYVTVKHSRSPSQLLQITLDCSKFVCNNGSLFSLQNYRKYHDLCDCADLQFCVDDEPNVSQDGFVLWRVYNFAQLLPIDLSPIIVDNRFLCDTKLSAIAQYVQTYRILPHLLISINLRTHQTSFLHCAVDWCFEAQDDRKEKTVFSISRRSSSKSRSKQIVKSSRLLQPPYIALPQFAYYD